MMTYTLLESAIRGNRDRISMLMRIADTGPASEAETTELTLADIALEEALAAVTRASFVHHRAAALRRGEQLQEVDNAQV